jgi:hypothetical protein
MRAEIKPLREQCAKHEMRLEATIGRRDHVDVEAAVQDRVSSADDKILRERGLDLIGVRDDHSQRAGYPRCGF